MALVNQPPSLAGRYSISIIPLEVVRMVVQYLPREDLSNARFINKTFAFVTAEPLFCSIPLWISIKSLKAITELSQATHLRDHVEHITFSSLRFIEHEDVDAYFTKVKTAVEIHTDSSSVSALQLGQHMAAYHASIEAQRYLTDESLDLKILTRAFKKFPNLQRITFDHMNSHIGARQLLSEFGTLVGADLLTCDGKHTFFTLIRAISESGTKILDLKIGYEDSYIFSPRPELGSMSPSPSYPDSLSTIAINEALRGDCWDHTRKVMSQLQSLEIKEIAIRDDRPELLRMAVALKRLISLAFNLQRINIQAIFSYESFDLMQTLSIEDLLEPQGLRYLRFLTLDGLDIPNHQHIVSFLSQHAYSLVKVVFISIELNNVKYVVPICAYTFVGGNLTDDLCRRWSAVLDQLRALRWPALKFFKLFFCRDPESKTLGHEERVDESWVHAYILHRSNRNPRVLPYEK